MEADPKPQLKVPNRVAKLKQLSIKYRELDRTEELKMASLCLDQCSKIKIVTHNKKAVNHRPKLSHRAIDRPSVKKTGGKESQIDSNSFVRRSKFVLK